MTTRRFLSKRSLYERHVAQQVKIVLVCEGKRTEPSYFSAYISARFRDVRKIQIVSNTSCNTGIEQLYEVACQKQQEFPNAVVFIVFDDDGKLCNATERRQLNNVLSKCAFGNAVSKAKINCIFSNPQFELWAILHFEYTTAVLTKQEIEARTKLYFPKYDPKCDKEIDYQIILDKPGSEDLAIKNAKRLRKYHEKMGGKCMLDCPSTNMDVLIEYMNSVCSHRPN